MPDRQLYPDGYFLFRDGEGNTIEEGKSYYPAAIVVRADRRRALQILRQIANYLGDGRDKEYPIDLTFSGTIETLKED